MGGIRFPRLVQDLLEIQHVLARPFWVSLERDLEFVGGYDGAEEFL